ncbi:MAG: FAD-dependent oxidoreductase [Opitutae bacterium]|nr:FAD-dependent oxidoreductase [Opitutae bacterium]
MKYSTEWDPFGMEYDVAVFGGGLSGVAAALTAAEKGQRVLLVERRSALGWETTCAFQCDLPEGDSPTVRRLRDRLKKLDAVAGDRIDSARTEYLLDLLVEEDDVDLLLYSQPVEVRVDHRGVCGVVIGNKSGEQLVRAKVIIDATEEALLFKQVGGVFHEVSQQSWREVFFFNNVENPDELPADVADGVGVEDIVLRPSPWEGEVCVEFTVPDYTCLEGRVRIRDVVAYLKEVLPSLSLASVSHAAFEAFPLECRAVLTGSNGEITKYENLLACGTWSIADSSRRKLANNNSGRIVLGEKVGEEAANLATRRGPMRGIRPAPAQRQTRHLQADVLVAGAGTGGSYAAIAAAKSGAKVIVLEACTMIGGMETGGGMHVMGHGVKGGIQDEVFKRVRADHMLFRGGYTIPMPNPILKAIVFEEIYKELGIQIIFGATVTGAVKVGNRITAAQAATPEGPVVVNADVFIDSTGDADLAIMAGAPFKTGREVDEILHCYTQCAETYSKDSGLVRVTNFDCGYTDPFDIVDLTRGKRQGLRLINEILLDEFRLLYAFPVLGIRQSRQIIGDYAPTMHDQIFLKHYDDCIGYSAAKFDCHSKDFANHNDFAVLWVWILGNRERHFGGEIPYRCMLPKDLEGILVACRSASCTNEANYQQRVIRNCRRMGEAAGIAAALCAKSGLSPRTLEVKLVQEELKKSGALGETTRPKPPLPDLTLEETKERFLSKNFKDAVWLLAHGSSESVAFLKEILEEGPEEKKIWAAIALAWHRDPAALPELVRVIEERPETAEKYLHLRRYAPFWMLMIVLLGRIGHASALPALIGILDDPKSDIDAVLASVRALGRIGDAAAIPALECLLRRDDLPRDRRFQMTSQVVTEMVGEDGLWQVELAIAEVLAEFGKPQPQVIEKHHQDPRPWVRRYVAIVEEKNRAAQESMHLAIPFRDEIGMRC